MYRSIVAAMAVAFLGALQLVAPSQAQAASGMASFYGYDFAGKPTANGERYNPMGMTAASRSLPFGTIVRVTNRNTGRSVIVRINDRGPFVGGRVIDLSQGAAGAIGMIASGVAPVDIQIVGSGSGTQVASNSHRKHRAAVQVAARSKRHHAAARVQVARVKSTTKVVASIGHYKPHHAATKLASAHLKHKHHGTAVAGSPADTTNAEGFANSGSN